MDPWLKVLIGVCTLLVIGVLAAFTQKPARVDKVTGTTTLYLNPLIRGLGLLCGVLIPLAVIAMFVLALRQEESLKTETYCYASGLFVGFAAFGWYFLLEGFKTHIIINDDGITYHSPWKEPQYFPWEEVVGAGFTLTGGYYVIENASGEKMSVSKYFDGLGKLKKAVESHLQEEDDEAEE